MLYWFGAITALALVGAASAQPAPPLRVLKEGESPYAQGPAPQTAPAPAAPDRYLRLVGEPTVRAGQIAKGGEVVSAPVAHMFTGRLQSPIQGIGGVLSLVGSVPAGSPVYAVPLDGKLSWCAPKRNETKRGAGWSADCFVQHFLWSGAYVHARGGGGLFVVRADRQGGSVYAPQVREEPVDFGPQLRLAYTFQGWDKRSAQIRMEVLSEGAPSIVRGQFIPREADGSVTMKLFGGEIRLVPDGPDLAQARIEVLSPPTAQSKAPI